MEKGLDVPASQVDLAFPIISLTSPTMGVIIGGFICNYIGGYQSPLALPLCMIAGALAFIFGFPLPFITGFPTFCTFLWL